MSFKLAEKWIGKAFTGNLIYVIILAVLILILIIIGSIFGFLAVARDWRYVFLGIFVVPVLRYLIKCLGEVTKNNPEILDKAKGTLEAANSQHQMAQIIREEEESEKQRGG